MPPLIGVLLVLGCGEEEVRHASFEGRLIVEWGGSAGSWAVGSAAEELLHLGGYDRAIRTLERSGPQPGSQAPFHNTLALAYLASFRESSRPQDLLQALEHASLAAGLLPNSPAALFNRALVLSEVPLPHSASRAWRDFLSREARGVWAQRAGQELVRMEAAVAPENRFQVIAGGLLSENELVPTDLNDALKRYPLQLRKLVERELLCAWGEAVTAGNDSLARRHLAVARRVAEGLAERSGDLLLLEAIGRIAAVSAESKSALAQLASGHYEYALGMEAYEERRLQKAGDLLESAHSRFVPGGSPFRLLTELHLGILDYLANLEAGQARFEALGVSLENTKYKALAADLHWMRGLVEVGRGQIGQALPHYRAALTLHEEVSGPAGSAAVEQLLAEALDGRGEVSEAWRHRLRALSALPYLEGPRRRHVVLNETAIALLKRGRSGLAEIFLTEVIENARAWGKLEFIAESRRLRARILIGQGRFREALDEADGALENLSAAGISPHFARIEASLWLTRGMALAAFDAESALEELELGWSTQKDRGFLSDRLPYLLARSRASRLLGRLDRAEEALLKAIAEFERLRRDTPGAGLARGEVFQWAQQAFDELLSVRLERGASALATWAVAEQARGRLLLDRWDEEPVEFSPEFMAEIAKGVQPDTLLAAYHLLPDKIIVWRVHDGGVEQLRVPGAPADLQAALESLRATLATNSEQAQSRRAVEERVLLYRLLIDPLRIPEGIERLVIIPDRVLSQVPFAVLRDPLSGSLLIERVALSLAPSALLAELARGRATRLRRRKPDLLVVSDPKLAATDAGRFPPLPGARAEVAAIRALYSQSSSLHGSAATATALVSNSSDRSVLHYAGHAAARLDLEDGVLLLAPENGRRGRLTLGDLVRQGTFDWELVALAACETAAPVGLGREGLFGLAAGFIAAGVPAVVAAQSEIDDRETRHLMIAFHRHYLEERDAARALRSAWLEARIAGADWQALRQLASFVVLGG